MATERRYLKGDVVEVVDYPHLGYTGLQIPVVCQRIENGVLTLVDIHAAKGMHMKCYAHQAKLLKRPWRNWLRLPFVKKVVMYQRSAVK